MGTLSYGLENKVVVVTGASRGIGLEIARLLIAQDARVVIRGRKPEGLAAAEDELQGGDNLLAIAARRAAPFMGVYGIARAGIEMMTRVIAQELAPFNVQINAVAPCMVRTRVSEPFWSNPDIYEQVVKTIPMGRIAEPADVAQPALFLCSPGANFITGQTLTVDGGATAV